MRLTNQDEPRMIGTEIRARLRPPYGQMHVNLQLFADDAAGSIDAGGEAGVTPADAAPDSASSAAPEMAFPLTQFEGSEALESVMRREAARQEAAQQPAPATTPPPAEQDSQISQPEPEAQPASGDMEAEWDQIRNGRFKEFFSRDTQKIVQNRLKESRTAEERFEKLAPALDLLAKHFNTTPGDLEALVEHITNDDALYQDEAIERGLDVQTLKQVKQLEFQNQLLQQREADREAREQASQHVMQLVQQARQAQQMYPNLDLQIEMQNPEFRRLTSPDVGLNVQTAYQIVHMQELQSQYVQAGAQQAEQRLSQAQQRNSRRPTENSSRPSQGTYTAPDPSKLGLDDLARKKQMAERGAAVPFF